MGCKLLRKVVYSIERDHFFRIVSLIAVSALLTGLTQAQTLRDYVSRLLPDFNIEQGARDLHLELAAGSQLDWVADQCQGAKLALVVDEVVVAIIRFEENSVEP